MKSIVLVVLFSAFVCILMYLHTSSESMITVCQAKGNVLLLRKNEMRTLKSTMDLSHFECKTVPMTNEELWKFRAVYRRSGGR